LEGAALTWDGSEFVAIRLLRLEGSHD
jgi:hypothetical protein